MAKLPNPILKSGQTAPEQTPPDPTLPDQDAPEQTAPDQTAPEQTAVQPDTPAVDAPAPPAASAAEAATLPAPPPIPAADPSPSLWPKRATPANKASSPAAVSAAEPCHCDAEASRPTFDCAPCLDPIQTVNRVIRDPNVSHAVSEWLGSETVAAYREGAPKGVRKALDGIAKAFAGSDAVPAKGEGCLSRLRLIFEMEDALTGTREPLDAQLASKIAVSLLDENYHLASGTPRFEDNALIFSQVEAKPIRISLDASMIESAELSDDFEVKYPNQKQFQKYRSLRPSKTGAAIASLTLALADGGAAQQGQGLKLVATLTQVPNWPDPSGTVSFYAYPDPCGENSSAAPILLGDRPYPVEKGTATCPVELGTGNGELPDGVYAVAASYSGDSNYAPATSSPLAINLCQYLTGDPKAAAQAKAKSGTPAASSRTDRAGNATPGDAQPISMPGYLVRMIAGEEVAVKLFLKPPLAQVRCFSWLEGDGAGCLPGNQYISRVAISAVHGEFRACKTTGDSGCAGFRLNPGWYRFSAPECIAIEGCNYSLASSSPVSAFLGAGQSCSDIFFRYKKKGGEIEVISEIAYPDPGNPYVTATDVFPGMQYLLLSENDPAFLEQQTASDGSPVYFRNLAAGPYLLFCQAPATYGSQPVQPVHPHGGRLALTVFGGQTAPVPVKVKFQTGNTAPALLDGYVRDDTGQPIAGLAVTAQNAAGSIKAAGVTDSTGKYAIPIYTAENLTLVAGAQQVSVSKAQIQAAMKSVGSPAPPSPSASFDQAMQRAELLAANN